jgi:hypothetical protein
MAETSPVEARQHLGDRSVPVTPGDPVSPVIIIVSIAILAVAVSLFVRLLKLEDVWRRGNWRLAIGPNSTIGPPDCDEARRRWKLTL